MTYREAYETWLKEFADDRATVDELKAIAGDEKEIEDRFYTELSFGTAGMRGVLGAGTNRMNLYNVRRATKGFADYINSQNPEYRQRGVVIAYDSRRMSPEFAKASALVLCHEGIHVYLFDELRPVPILSYAVRHLHAIAGIVITASHNPPQYNGYKVYWEDGAQMPPEYADQVLARIRANRYEDAVEMDEAEAKAKGLLQIIGSKEVDDDYIAQVKTLSVQPELMKTAGKELKIVYTPLHGSGNKPVRRILKEIGIENVYVVKEQELPDPNFSTVKVPNLTGKEWSNAQVQLNIKGLKHHLAESESDQTAALVTYQYPRAGAEVPYGTTVYLYTDTYEGKHAEVPDVTGKSADFARQMLNAAGFNCTVEGSGTVQSQSEAPGSSVQQGTIVHLICG